ncbi:barstar family protein [Celerinatantimonas sp. MCCC 1A17872]|uniref:barstar family protein n=1 Tax=Celerinatantimonas sp. MCCC 1A17872 TaxID=3177514 RepID=UPI0038BE7015
MTKYTIDCENVHSKSEFWKQYLAIVEPEGAGYFGRNLDALWDALHAGGPGFPDESDCTIRLINTDSIKLIDDGAFYHALKQISSDLKSDLISHIAFKVE